MRIREDNQHEAVDSVTQLVEILVRVMDGDMHMLNDDDWRLIDRAHNWLEYEDDDDD